MTSYIVTDEAIRRMREQYPDGHVPLFRADSLTAVQYRSPDGRWMLTWGDLYALVDDLPTDHPMRVLLVQIMDGNVDAARAVLGLTKAEP